VFWIWPLVLDVFPHLRPRPCKVEWELDIGTMFYFLLCVAIRSGITFYFWKYSGSDKGVTMVTGHHVATPNTEIGKLQDLDSIW
jgi:hypothetical protein